MQKLLNLLRFFGRLLNNLVIGLISGLVGGLIYLFCQTMNKLSLINCLQFNFQDVNAQVGVNPRDINVTQIMYDFEHDIPIHVPLNLNATLSSNALTVNPDCIQTIRQPIMFGATAGLALGVVFTTAYQLFRCRTNQNKTNSRTIQDNSAESSDDDALLNPNKKNTKW